MTGRERVIAAIERTPLDRIPVMVYSPFAAAKKASIFSQEDIDAFFAAAKGE